MNPLHVEHLGIVVKSIEEAFPSFEGVLGPTCYSIEEVTGQKMHTAFLKIGEVKLELLESTSDGSPIAKFIEECGEGIHHLVLSFDDVAPALEEPKGKGICFVDEKPCKGAEGLNIVSVHPKSVHGILLEICDREDAAKQLRPIEQTLHRIMSVQQEKIKQLFAKREEARLGGGEERTEKQHVKGKCTVRERIAMLLDEDPFEGIDMLVQHRCTDFDMERKKLLGDDVVVGSGTIDRRLVYVFAQDFTVVGGAFDEMFAAKTCKIMDLVMTTDAPCIGLNDLGGVHIQEAVDASCSYGEIFERSILALGVTLQISDTFGLCAGSAVYSPAPTDLNIMVCNSSYMFLTGPKAVRTVISEDVTQEELGGADVHASKNGVAHFTVDNDGAGLQSIHQLLSSLP